MNKSIDQMNQAELKDLLEAKKLFLESLHRGDWTGRMLEYVSKVKQMNEEIRQIKSKILI